MNRGYTDFYSCQNSPNGTLTAGESCCMYLDVKKVKNKPPLLETTKMLIRGSIDKDVCRISEAVRITRFDSNNEKMLYFSRMILKLQIAVRTALVDADEMDPLSAYPGLERCVACVLQSGMLIVMISNINFHFYAPGVL